MPFLSKRKAAVLSEQISSQVQKVVTGTFDHLVSRIDLLAVAGHPKHSAFMEAISAIVGIQIATKASANGKVAGAFFDDDRFIELSQMGDGITELVALVVELVLERGKVFIVEEPETSLHPSALKGILKLLKAASEFNQFFITTHSNIVVAELAGDPECELFRVTRPSQEIGSPSVVEKIPHDDHEARRAILADLGYELSDFGLYDAWLFFEESSAERVYMDLLLPLFAPELQGRVRSFSANGVGALAKKIDLFLTMITFVYLQPVYSDRLWVTADGCDAGHNAIETIRNKFPNVSQDRLINFQQEEFEFYYPIQFREIVKEVSQIENRQLKREAKKKLLNEVLTWHREDPQRARPLWEETASEHIALLRQISAALNQ